MKKIPIGLLVTTAALSVQANAEGAAELMIGFADQSTEIANYGSTSGDDISFGLRGVYSFNENIAIEVAFQDYGETDDTYIDSYGDTINDRISASALTAGVKGSVPIQGGLSLSARIGLSSWDVDIRETDSASPGEVYGGSDDGSDLYYGVGLQFDLNDAVYVGAEYTITEMGLSIGSADHEVKNLGLFVGYSF